MALRKSAAVKRLRKAAALIALILAASFSTSCMAIPILLRTDKRGTDSTSVTEIRGQETAANETDDIETLKEIDFSMFAENVTTDTLSLHFTVSDPESLGLSVPAATLGDVSREAEDDKYSSFEAYLGRLDDIDYDSLPEDYRIMFDVLRYDLEEALAYKDYYYYSSPFNSITGIQTELPLVLSEYRLETKADIETYLLLLKDMPRYYGDLIVFEQERADQGLGASDQNLQKIIDSCGSFLDDRENHFLVSSFAERLDGVDGLTDAERQDYIARNQSALDDYVFPAYQQLIDGFTALMGTGKTEGGLCTLPGGKDYYELLLKSQTSSDASVTETAGQIESAINEEINTIVGTTYDSDFENAYNSYNFSKGTIRENLDYCADAIREDFPSEMEHSVRLEEVPSQLEDFFSPAAYLSCTIDDPTDNLILTNSAALAGYKNILETVAHEGYPGHMYEAIYHAREIEGYYQRTANFIGYAEGWAEYAAGYVMSHSDYDQALVAYVSAENQIFNILFPARIDIGVNDEGWSRDDVYSFLADYNLDMQEYADYCYDMAVEIPCYYMPYCVGHLNTDRILDSARDKLGSSATLKEIHKAYLDIGPAPFPIVEKYMDEYAESAKS